MKVSEIQISYRPNIKPSLRPLVSNADDIYKIICENINIEDQAHIERFYIMLFDRKNSVLGIQKLADGGVSGCLVDTKLVFQYALGANASGIALWHNHPSGNMKPSMADINITQRIKRICNDLDIAFLDHLIIDSEGNYAHGWV